MKKLYPILTFLAALTFFTNTAKATHAMAVDITYRSLGGLQYEVSLHLYRDCSGIVPSPFKTMMATSVSCDTFAPIFCSQPSGAVEVTPVCPSQLIFTSCNGGSLPGVQEHTYVGTVTLPSGCTDWVFSHREHFRNASINTIFFPEYTSLYVEAHLNNLDAPGNSSPAFSNLPVPFICNSQPFIYNHGAVDPDGDSLVFSLVSAMDNSGVPVVYLPGFSPASPMSSTPGMTIDQENGDIQITPPGLQTGIVTVQVAEYRQGILIGTVVRDMQITVVDCGSNNVPSLAPLSNLTGGIQSGDFSIEVCPGTPVSFDITGTDTDPGDQLSLDWNQAIAGASFSTSGTNPVTGTFNWTPGTADLGFHMFTVNLKDDGCPIIGQQTRAISIRVQSGTSAGPDRTYCTGDAALLLPASGGSTFSWTILSGDTASLSCLTCKTPEANPATTTTYEVISDLPCNNRDTVQVSVFPGFSLNTSPDLTTCGFDPVALHATPTGTGTYSYEWTPATGLSDPSSPSPTAYPAGNIMYRVAVSDGNCVVKDSVNLTLGQGMTLEVTADQSVFCQGSPVPLHANLSVPPATCGINPAGCSGTTEDFTIGAGASLGDIGSSPFLGYYTDGRTQYLLTAAELAQAGLTGGTLTALSLYVAEKNSTQPYESFSISLGCTQATGLGSWFESGLSTVFSGNISTVAGWNVFTLNTAYDWDGVSNLVVEICFDNTSWSDYDRVLYSATDFYSVTQKRQDNTSGCSLSNPSVSHFRPNIRLTGCKGTGIVNNSLFSFAWEPASGLSDPTVAEPMASPSVSCVYSVTVSNPAGNCQLTDSVRIEPAFLDAGPNQTTCNPTPGNPVTLNANYSGPGTNIQYIWSPANLLSDPNSPDPNTAPSATTTFTISVDNGNCIITDQVQVVIDCTLPVSVLEFTAENVAGKSRVHWTTSKETNSDHFVVERSMDGLHFDQIGWILAAGESDSLIEYSFVDEFPKSGENYYRLQMVDQNGDYSFSGIASVIFGERRTESYVLAYPNPTEGEITLDLKGKEGSGFSLRILNSAGIRVYERLLDDNSSYRWNVDLHGLSSGIYLYEISNPGGSWRGKLTIVQ